MSNPIKYIVTDLSKVLLFPKDKGYEGGLNSLYKDIREKEDFNFFDHFEINQELLDFLKTLKEKYDLSIFTSNIIQNDKALEPILTPIFKNIISANNDVGISKKEKESYIALAKRIGANPEEMLYIDDSEKNIRAAFEAGLKTLQYTNNEELINRLKYQLLWNEYRNKYNKYIEFREEFAPIDIKQSQGLGLSDEERKKLEEFVKKINNLHEIINKINESKINK